MKKLIPLLLLACQSEYLVNTGVDSPFVFESPGEPPRAIQEDVFLQGSPRPVDIVFVIDQSCSMNDDVISLVDAIPSFLVTLNGWGLDYNLGVTSAEGYAPISGKLNSYRDLPFLTEETPNAESYFSYMAFTAPGLGEAGFGAIVNGIQKHYDEDFYRPGIPLHYVVISDENEQSGYSPDFMEGFLTWDIENIKGASATLSAVVTTRLMDGCAYREQDIGTRYLEVARRTGGMTADICMSNWEYVLDSLASLAANYRWEYTLSNYPVENTIRVTAEIENGAVVEFSPEEYIYNRVRNSITFEDWEQSENDIVHVEYEVKNY